MEFKVTKKSYPVLYILSSSSSSSYMQLGHLLTRPGLTYPEVSSKVYYDSFCQLASSVSLPWVIYFEASLHFVCGYTGSTSESGDLATAFFYFQLERERRLMLPSGVAVNSVQFEIKLWMVHSGKKPTQLLRRKVVVLKHFAPHRTLRL